MPVKSSFSGRWHISRFSRRHDRAGRAAHLDNVADLAGKLRANGMSLADVHQLEGLMRGLKTSETASQDEPVKEVDAARSVFTSNVALKARIGADNGVAEARLARCDGFTPAYWRTRG
jgi:hypothetical protein